MAVRCESALAAGCRSRVIESPSGTCGADAARSQWDRGGSLGRRDITTCLTREYAGEKILASMGSLAHYMQELSGSGFAIADFVNEGNGVIWNMALQTGPAPHTGWMLVEEVAEGGDMLAERVRRDPAFTQGMTRVCEGGGVALYRRDEMTGYLPNLTPNVTWSPPTEIDRCPANGAAGGMCRSG